MTAAATRQTIVDDPEVVHKHGGTERRYWLVGGRKVEDTDTGNVWFECRFCDFTSATPHGITVHRGWRHPGEDTTRTAAGQPRTHDDHGTDHGRVVLRVTRALDRLRTIEAERDEWRDRALNAEAAARALRGGTRA